MVSRTNSGIDFSRDCVQILVKSHEAAPQDKLKFVYKKYSSMQFGAVSLHPPATQLLGELKLRAASSSGGSH